MWRDKRKRTVSIRLDPESFYYLRTNLLEVRYPAC